MNAAIIAVCAIGGLLVGDQLEIVVEQVGAKAYSRPPWWKCPECSARATGWANVPLIRTAALRRPCERCGKVRAHSRRPLVLALVTGAILGAFAWRFGADFALAPFAIFAIALVAISAIDLERLIIPNLIVYPTLATVLPLLVISSAIDGRWSSMWRAALAGAVGFAAFFLVHVVTPRGMGFGDARLAGLVGLMTGWLGLGHAFVAVLASFVLASVIGIAAAARSGMGRKTRIPFGPFLAAGAVFAVLWGDPIANVIFHHGA